MIDMILKTLGESKLVAQILENEKLMDALLKALSVSLEAKKHLETQYEQTLNNMSLAPLSRVRAVEEELQSVEEELKALREQLTHLSAEAREGRAATQELSATQEVVAQAQRALEHAKQELAKRQEDQERMQASLEDAYAEIMTLRERLGEGGEPTLEPSSAVAWSKRESKSALLEIAAQHNVKVKASMKKAELVMALREALGAPVEG